MPLTVDSSGYFNTTVYHETLIFWLNQSFRAHVAYFPRFAKFELHGFCFSDTEVTISIIIWKWLPVMTFKGHQLRVLAISTGLRIDRHWWVDPYLLPPVEAKFSVAGASSQRQEPCWWRHQGIAIVLVKRVYSCITSRYDQKVGGINQS